MITSVAAFAALVIKSSDAFVPSLRTTHRTTTPTTSTSTSTIIAPSSTSLFYKNETMGSDNPAENIEQSAPTGSLADLCPFTKIMAANRGEIAVRINRAATELNLNTVSLYAYEGKS